MGSDSGWQPINLSYDAVGNEECVLLRDQVVSALAAADPDAINRAGQAFLDAADLVGGTVAGMNVTDSGIQAALSRAAGSAADAWRGEAATSVQVALRQVYATAGSLGDALVATGATLRGYAATLTWYRDNMPSAVAAGSEQTNPDAAARMHLRALNRDIAQLSRGFPSGLAFDLPVIAPLDVDPGDAGRISMPDVSEAPGGPGSAGTWTASGTPASGADDTADGTVAPSSPSTGPATVISADPAPDDLTPTPAPDGDQGADTVPSVIGATDPATGTDAGTRLADIGQSLLDGQGTPATPLSTISSTAAGTTTTPGGTTMSPGGLIGTMGHTYRDVPGIGGEYGPGTRYGIGSGVGRPASSSGVVRGVVDGMGSPFLPFAPFGGTAGMDQECEQDRTIYDPDSDIWHTGHQTSPNRIG